MQSIATSLVILTIACCATALTLNPFTWKTHHHHQKTPGPQVIEIVRWRQKVCLQPAPGVSSCLLDMKQLQMQYEQTKGKGGAETKEGYSILTESIDSSSEEQERDEIIKKLESSEPIDTLPLGYMQSSQTEEFVSESSQKTAVLTEEQERNVRDGKYLVPDVEKLVNPRQQIYVTKVVDSPVTATLVAYNCLPDIGVPLCQPQQTVLRPPAPGFIWRPAVTVAVNQQAHENRPAGVWQIVKEPLQSEVFMGDAVAEEIQNPESQVVIKESNSSQTIEGQSGLQHIEISNQGKAEVSYPAEVPEASQPTQQKIDRELIKQVEDSKIVKGISNQGPVSTEQGDHPILQALHGLVEKTENSDIVKHIQNFLHGTDDEDEKIEEPGVTAFLNKLRPVNIFDHEEQLDAKSKLSGIAAETLGQPSPRISVDVESGVAAEAKVGVSGKGLPEISATVKPRIVTDFNAILPSTVDSVISEDAKEKVSVELNPKLTGQLQPEVSQNVQPEIAADVKTLLSTNESPIISKLIAPKISTEVRPEFFVKMIPEIPADAIPEVTAESSTGVRSHFSADVKSAVLEGIRTESLADTKSEISTGVKPVVPLTTTEDLGSKKTVLPVREITPLSDHGINEKIIELAEEAQKEISETLDKSQIDEKTQDIGNERPVGNQNVLPSLLPNPVKLLKNENEK